MKRNLLTALAGGLVITGAAATYAPPDAEAQARFCTSRAQLINTLQNKYHEQRRGLGLASSTGVMEMYVSEKGTWTVVMTLTDGRSCILAAGKHYENVPPVALLEGVES